MTDLDHFLHVVFLMLIFSYSDPLQKAILSEVGAFSKNAVRTAFLACLFPFTNTQPHLHARNAVRTAFLACHYKSYSHSL